MHPCRPRGSFLLVPALFWLALLPTRLQAAPYELGREVDYRFPPNDLSLRAAPLRVIPGPAFGGGEVVSYQAFDGTWYTLTRFRGRHVAVLLPGSWMGEGKLDEPLIEVFVDRSDLLYETYRELVGGEPGPEGLLNIAVVPVTCGFGCGWVGAKGIEVAGDQGALDLVRPELATGHTPEVVSHEMGHNFDLYNAYLGYWGDFAHAWTWLVQTYTYMDSLEGTADRSPEDIFRQSLRLTFEKYMADPCLTWESCLRDGLCSIRNEAWAGTLWRLARLHGPGALRGYAGFLRDWRASHPQPPATAEERNDLHVEAMAAGASRNLGCYVDAWRWRASPELRARMQGTYGPGNAFCEDMDADAFSRLAGDCDDGDPAVRPGAVEVANQRDDDCDGLVDDLSVVEPPAEDFPHPQPIPFPADITGRITDGNSDRFVFQAPSARKVRIELCPDDPQFRGWVFVYQRDGSWLGYQHSGGVCSSRTYDLDDAGAWEFSVELNVESRPGRYRVALFEPDPLPAPPWSTTASRLMCVGSYAFTAAAVGSGPAAATHVRFWVSGIGMVGSAPYSPLSRIRWAPPAGLDPAAHHLRVQALANGIPVAPFTVLAPVLDEAPCQPQGLFFTLTPCRLLDTRRPAEGPALASGTVASLPTHGRCGIPATARALAVNVTATDASAGGHLTLYPGGAPSPPTSTINFGPGQTRANNAILPLSAKGAGTLALTPALAGGGTVHVIVDVSGWFE